MTFREMIASLRRWHVFVVGLFVGVWAGVWASGALPWATFAAVLSPFAVGYTIASAVRSESDRRSRAAEYRSLAELVRSSFAAGRDAESIARAVERGEGT